MRHIYIEEPYGPEAICFYEYVFGAKVINKATKRINTNRGTTRFVSSELQFGPNCITVSEWNPNSDVVDESNCTTGAKTPTIIWLDMKDIDPVVTRAKKLDIVIDEEDLSTSSYGRLAKIEDPYGIIWMVRSVLLDSSEDIKDAKQGHEVEEAEKVTIWEKQQQIYVKQPNGHKAINFCKSVFGAKEVTSNEQTKMVNEKANTSLVISELNFGHKSIIVSEVDDDSSFIDKNAGIGVRTPDYIYVELEHSPSTVGVALCLGARCDIVDTDVGYLIKIIDPFGNTWLARSRA